MTVVISRLSEYVKELGGESQIAGHRSVANSLSVLRNCAVAFEADRTVNSRTDETICSVEMFGYAMDLARRNLLPLPSESGVLCSQLVIASGRPGGDPTFDMGTFWTLSGEVLSISLFLIPGDDHYGGVAHIPWGKAVGPRLDDMTVAVDFNTDTSHQVQVENMLRTIAPNLFAFFGLLTLNEVRVVTTQPSERINRKRLKRGEAPLLARSLVNINMPGSLQLTPRSGTKVDHQVSALPDLIGQPSIGVIAAAYKATSGV